MSNYKAWDDLSQEERNEWFDTFWQHGAIEAYNKAFDAGYVRGYDGGYDEGYQSGSED